METASVETQRKHLILHNFWRPMQYEIVNCIIVSYCVDETPLAATAN